MSADGLAIPGIHRPLQCAQHAHRAAPRAVHVDQGFVSARLAFVAFYNRWLATFVLAVRAFGYSSADNSHGRQHVPPAVDDAVGRRPESAQDDDADAADVYFHVCVVSRRSDGLLAG